MGGGGRLLASALVTMLAATAWTLGNMLPFFFLLNRVGLMRVEPEDEERGLDIAFHGGFAYDQDSGSHDSNMELLALTKTYAPPIFLLGSVFRGLETAAASCCQIDMFLTCCECLRCSLKFFFPLRYPLYYSVAVAGVAHHLDAEALPVLLC